MTSNLRSDLPSPPSDSRSPSHDLAFCFPPRVGSADARLYATRAARSGCLSGVSPSMGAQRLTSARVSGRVHLAQPLDGHQRVHLRRRHRGVAEQFLDDAHIGATVEQVGRERVPQRVR